jgi:hypothetical protein
METGPWLLPLLWEAQPPTAARSAGARSAQANLLNFTARAVTDLAWEVDEGPLLRFMSSPFALSGSYRGADVPRWDVAGETFIAEAPAPASSFRFFPACRKNLR